MKSHTDEQLLHAFISSIDETAFETLVNRHGPMVWGVCTRVLRNHHDAEDAFQATFLILAQRASSIQQPGLLPNWLYSVAYDTAMKSRQIRGTRRLREMQAAMNETPKPESSLWKELSPYLDKALNLLNEKYRTPIIFHDLLGMSYEEAARQIGISVRSFAMRLSRGRKMLRGKLSQMGILLSVGSLTALVIQNGTTAIPLDSHADTARRVLHSLSSISTGEPVSGEVVDLAQQSINSWTGGLIASVKTPTSTPVWLAVSTITAISLLGTVNFFSTASAGNPEAEPRTSAVSATTGQSDDTAQQSEACVSRSISLYPVTTVLQQKLIEQQHPKSPSFKVFVEIDFEELLREVAYDFTSETEQIRNLVRDLKSNHENNQQEVFLQVVYGSDLPKSDIALIRELELGLSERAKQEGLPDPVISQTVHNSREGLANWRSHRLHLREEFPPTSNGMESPLQGDGYAVYPIETTLSRILTQDADALLEFKEPIDLDKPPTLSDDLKKSSIRDIKQLNLNRTERMMIVGSVRFPQKPIPAEFEQQTAREIQQINQKLNQLAQELGFAKLSIALRYLN